MRINPALWGVQVIPMRFLQHAIAAIFLLASGCAGNQSQQAATPPVSRPQAGLPDLPQADGPNIPRDLSKATIALAGKDYYAVSAAGVAQENNSLRLTSTPQAAAYAIYQFPGTVADQLQSVTAIVSDRVIASTPVYLAVGNYALGMWQWFPAVQGNNVHHEISVNQDQYVSPGGNCYVAVLAYNGEQFMLDSVEAEYANRLPLPTQWTQAGYNAQRSRRSEQSVINSANVLWKVDLGELLNGSAPVIGGDGRIYIGGFALSGPSHMHAVNPDGSVAWQAEVSASIRSTPSIADNGSIYFGVDNGYLFALNSLGAYRWNYKMFGDVPASPVLSSDGNIYVGSLGMRFCAIDPQGQQIWEQESAYSLPSSAALATDGTIYMLLDGLHALTPQGQLLWTYDPQGGIADMPAVGADGTIYLATGVSGVEPGVMHAIWPTGAERGKYALSASGFGTAPALAADGTVYVGGDDGKLYKFSASAALLDSYDTGAPVQSAPAIDGDGDVIVANTAGRIAALNSALQLQWEYQTQTEFRSALAIGNHGELYAAGFDGMLYAFGPNAAAVPAAPTGLSATDALFPNKVVLTWDEGFDADGYYVYRDGAPAPVATLGYLQKWEDTTLTDTDPHTYFLVAFNGTGSSAPSNHDVGSLAEVNTDPPAWAMFGGDAAHTGRSAFDGPRAEHFAWSYQAAGGNVYSIGSVVVGGNGDIFISYEVWPDGTGRLVSLNSAGQFRWSKDLVGAGIQAPGLGQDGTVYVVCSGMLSAYTPSGDLLWEKPKPGGGWGPLLVGPDDSLYASVYDTMGSNKTYKFSPVDGATLLTLNRGNRHGAPALGSDGSIYVMGSNRVTQFAANGTSGLEYGSFGTLEGSACVRQDAVNGDWVYYTDRDRMYGWAVDKSDDWNYIPANGGKMNGAPIIASDGSVICSCSLGMTSFAPFNGAINWQSPTAASAGGNMFPMLDSAGYIYACTSSGIWCLQPDGELQWSLAGLGNLTYSAVALGPEGNIYFSNDAGLLYSYGVGP